MFFIKYLKILAYRKHRRMCYNCRHMRYTRHKKPLVVALFLIFTVSMALVSKNVAYAEETVEPTEVK